MSRRRFCFLGAIAIAAFASLVLWEALRGDLAEAQSGMTYPLPQSTAPGQNTGRPQLGQEPDASQDSLMHHALTEAAKKRNIDRQNKIRADSDKIVQLAHELSNSVQTEDRNPTPTEMAKKADEIGKLARSVRDLMKSE